VHLALRLGHLRCRDAPHHRRDREVVDGLVQRGDARDRREGLVLGVAGDAADMRDGALDELHLEGGVGARLALRDAHLVEARSQRLDRLEGRGDLRVLLQGHLAGDEDAQVPDVLVHQVDDGLAEAPDLALVAVDVGDPAQRLAGRGDVVARGGEDDDGRAHRAHVEGGAARGADLAAGEAVADEQVLDDPADLVAVHQEEAAPPALELEEALRLAVRGLVEVPVLAEPGVARRQRLEVHHQVGAVEAPRAEVRHQRRRPGSAARPPR
jgi:hypothetical protein